MKTSTILALAAIGAGFALTRKRKVPGQDAVPDQFSHGETAYVNPCGEWTQEDEERAWGNAVEKIRTQIGTGPEANHPRNESDAQRLAFNAAYTAMFHGLRWAGCEERDRYLPFTIDAWQAAKGSWPLNVRAKWEDMFGRALHAARGQIR